jgi:type I restriction enzyme S subunit
MMNSSFVDSLLKNAQGVAIKNVAAVKELKLIPFALPPLSVQKEIVVRLDKLSENVKRLEANYKQIIANCDELKKSILKKTFEEKT